MNINGGINEPLPLDLGRYFPMPDLSCIPGPPLSMNELTVDESSWERKGEMPKIQRYHSKNA